MKRLRLTISIDINDTSKDEFVDNLKDAVRETENNFYSIIKGAPSTSYIKSKSIQSSFNIEDDRNDY